MPYLVQEEKMDVTVFTGEKPDVYGGTAHEGHLPCLREGKQ
jgi:hypothetical protein